MIVWKTGKPNMIQIHNRAKASRMPLKRTPFHRWGSGVQLNRCLCVWLRVVLMFCHSCINVYTLHRGTILAKVLVFTRGIGSQSKMTPVGV